MVRGVCEREIPPRPAQARPVDRTRSGCLGGPNGLLLSVSRTGRRGGRRISSCDHLVFDRYRHRMAIDTSTPQQVCGGGSVKILPAEHRTLLQELEVWQDHPPARWRARHKSPGKQHPTPCGCIQGLCAGSSAEATPEPRNCGVDERIRSFANPDSVVRCQAEVSWAGREQQPHAMACAPRGVAHSQIPHTQQRWHDAIQAGHRRWLQPSCSHVGRNSAWQGAEPQRQDPTPMDQRSVAWKAGQGRQQCAWHSVRCDRCAVHKATAQGGTDQLRADGSHEGNPLAAERWCET